ncbi:hypothetical protein [Ponticaulis sp.]|uniref:hypothetical protein n=1 Tax=Ponticaulis sp. TaxID=2020902 RepID=UPI000B6C81CA|nr:hypothetical protein [Ponticaulis sp.]MAJ07565.1 DUF3052 domain-containing protein [Ponticaulis sp.]RPG17795.1 MAG: DUF3052 domain-containing protein [Hyphomonadaceae bacterium TMED125]HBH89512.1 DUF3052 domain-containing protein [Hyphomonadaceae bacterium]HBJ94131.1 DUF3052 domain-containing protein [Hyphomonadaceae bacterium]|tara:strand:+ start:47200 stop:47601 length:402 start_codon:yes stop_codon:yes gene_type:complete
MSAQPAGYSGKPLWRKLGIKPGMRVLPVNPPDHYDDLIDGAEGMEEVVSGPAEIVHLFCDARADLDAGFGLALAQVAPGGMLWVSWPKKSSKRFIDLTEDQLREVILPTGWVDVKVCAVDADWSGLKFLKRKS